MKLADMMPSDQIFTHTDLDDGSIRHFNPDAIIRAIRESKIVPYVETLNLYQDLIDFLRSNHGVEEDHLQRIDHKLEDPILVAYFGPLEENIVNLIIDGSHRVVRRWDKGLRDVPAILLSQEQWEPYLIEGLEDTTDPYEMTRRMHSAGVFDKPDPKRDRLLAEARAMGKLPPTP